GDTKMKAVSAREIGTTNNLRKVFMSYFPVQAFSNGLPAINTLISSFIIGNFFGSKGLAAIGFAGPFTTLMLAIATTISMGSQLLCGKLIGKGDRTGVKSVYSSAIVLCLVFGVLLMVFAANCTGTIVSWLGTSQETYSMTKGYIRGQAVGMIAAVLCSSLIPFVQLDQAKKVSTVAIAVMVTVNVGYNFANALFFHGGMFGVGLASSLGYISATAICLFYLIFKSSFFKFSISDISFRSMKNIFRFGIPTAVSNICMVFRDRGFNAVLFGMGGTMAVSAATLAINFSNAVGGNTIQGGYSGTANLLSSVLVGERDVDSLRKMPKTIIQCIYPIYIVAYILIFIFSKNIVLAFGADPEYLDLFVMALRLYCLWFFSNPFKTPSLSIYWALGKVRLVSLFYFINDLAAPFFSYFVLSKFFGIAVVFAATIINEVFTVTGYITYYTIKMKKMPKSLFEITYIPRSLGVAKEDTLALVIQNEASAVNVSSQVIDFCKSKGMSAGKSYYCGLAIEEMAVDKIINGNKKQSGLNPLTIDVRVYYEDNGISIMLRDNCEEFNPEQWMELHAPEDPLRSLGLKMVTEMSSDFSYQSTLGLNVYTIRIEPDAA
ncbi:MAG: MATE family efflux transporter, partial [Lachnospiraceae bacterium]|nr:MATE family efflux transporter [Lachnospiraceae bacterium]